VSSSAATMCHMSAPEIASAAEIGRRILAARDALRLSQQDFAERAGLSRAYISRLERGLIPNPTITDLGKVAEAAGVSVAELTTAGPRLVETRFSHDVAEIHRQVDALPVPDEVKASILRGFLQSIEVMHAASTLARRN
jgi:transcriptional regulator with XRE-family HTH domain